MSLSARACTPLLIHFPLLGSRIPYGFDLTQNSPVLWYIVASYTFSAKSTSNMDTGMISNIEPW
jgi:hypothetical protein